MEGRGGALARRGAERRPPPFLAFSSLFSPSALTPPPARPGLNYAPGSTAAAPPAPVVLDEARAALKEGRARLKSSDNASAMVFFKARRGGGAPGPPVVCG